MFEHLDVVPLSYSAAVFFVFFFFFLKNPVCLPVALNKSDKLLKTKRLHGNKYLWSASVGGELSSWWRKKNENIKFIKINQNSIIKCTNSNVGFLMFFFFFLLLFNGFKDNNTSIYLFCRLWKFTFCYLKDLHFLYIYIVY